MRSYIFKAIQAGANGYILKDEPPKMLMESIIEITQGVHQCRQV
jgi:DNA-binding NarL/FixJ family response regulator